jgi:hypothetical protein
MERQRLSAVGKGFLSSRQSGAQAVKHSEKRAGLHDSPKPIKGLTPNCQRHACVGRLSTMLKFSARKDVAHVAYEHARGARSGRSFPS